MNLRTFTVALLLAVPFTAHAGTQATQTWINGRTVTIRTEVTPADPAKCQHVVEQQLARGGWYNEIYRAADGDKAFLIFSQRAADPCQAKSVKVTLWRAVAQNGTTTMEAHEYNLKPAEVNSFLDTELLRLAVQFQSQGSGQS